MRTKTLWIKEPYLQHILAGRKKVEVRVGYANITRLQPGDLLMLNDQYPYHLIEIRQYPDFEILLNTEDPVDIAPDLSREALLTALRQLYPPEKEALGVIALHIEAK